MSEVNALEQAILDRAMNLAEEFRRRAERGRDDILREVAERIHVEEEREVLAAKAAAEREYQRQVQAEELKLQRHMDHIRWELVEGVKADMLRHLNEYAEHDAAYVETLKQWLSVAVAELPETALVVQCNARDRERLVPLWQVWREELGRDMSLSEQTLTIAGGLRVRDVDNRVRVDQSFEARLQRLHEPLHRVIVERLLPPQDTHLMFEN